MNITDVAKDVAQTRNVSAKLVNRSTEITMFNAKNVVCNMPLHITQSYEKCSKVLSVTTQDTTLVVDLLKLCCASLRLARGAMDR